MIAVIHIPFDDIPFSNILFGDKAVSNISFDDIPVSNIPFGVKAVIRIPFRRMAENGFAPPPPREFCRHILSCSELKAESFKRCLHSVLRGVSP